MLWKKPNGMKYTEMCVYIDQNVPAIGEGIATVEIENKVYNYLWLLVKALAIKKCMFANFDDYDGYAFYSASRLYLALKRNYQNQGKVIKGKLIRPIKSCLNYTKALLYPMKVEYQREAYAEILSSEENINKKFDVFAYKEKMKTSVITSQAGPIFKQEVQDLFMSSTRLFDSVLENSPFRPKSTEYKWLKISMMLNILNNIKQNKRIDYEPNNIILWHLPKTMQGYVKVLLKEFCIKLKQEISECTDSIYYSDSVITSILKNPTDERVDNVQ